MTQPIVQEKSITSLTNDDSTLTSPPKGTHISSSLAKFRQTGNPVHLGKAVFLVLTQRRLKELAYGVYCNAFFKPSVVTSTPQEKDLQSLIGGGLSFSSSDWYFSRKQLVTIFGKQYAIHQLPADFYGTRSESIVFENDFLIIGEYGKPLGKRLAYITRDSCTIYDHYQSNKNVVHFHSVYKCVDSCEILVTTGDSEKRLDLWRLQDNTLVFDRMLRKNLAGYTAITSVGSLFYMGTDFSSRPNYIERLIDRKKFFFPDPAFKMFVIAFQEIQNRYIVAISSELSPLGQKRALSIFDTTTEEFIYCDYVAKHLAGKALRQKVVPLRSS